jgi:hypothetical protein
MDIETRHRQKKETRSYSLENGNRHKGSWTSGEGNDKYSDKKYTDTFVNPIDDGSESCSIKKKYNFKTPPRTLMVQNRYLFASKSSGGASTTDDASSSMQRSARRAIAKSRRAALENYKALTSQVSTQTTEGETAYASVKCSTTKMPSSSFNSYSTWETNDSMDDIQLKPVVINATPSTHRLITKKLNEKDLSIADGGDDADDDDDSFLLKNTTTYTSFSHGIPWTVRSTDSDDSGTLFDKLFACCPPTVTFHEQNEDFTNLFQKLENEKSQDDVYTYFK